MGMECSTNGTMRNAYMVGKAEKKETTGKTKT
jgi:hypothetical protein